MTKLLQFAGLSLLLIGIVLDSPKYPIPPFWLGGVLLWMLPLLPHDIRNSGR